MNLYQLTERYQQITDLACEESDDEGQISADFAAILESLEGEITDKFEQCGFALRNLQAMEAAFKTERDRLAKRASSLGDRIQKLKEHLKEQLLATGQAKLQAGIFSFRVQNNSQSSVNVLDEAEIPDEYWFRPAPEVDKRKILEAEKSGVAVPGVQLSRGNHLRVT